MTERKNPHCPVPNCLFNGTEKCGLASAVTSMSRRNIGDRKTAESLYKTGCINKDHLQKTVDKHYPENKVTTQKFDAIKLAEEAAKTPYIR